MQLSFKVERNRQSVTQGEVDIILNGEKVITFGDKISLEGEYHVLGGWGSTVSDQAFIKSVLFPHPANAERIEKRIKEILSL